MIILRSQNKITDFLMILAWACPFKVIHLNENDTKYLGARRAEVPLCTNISHTVEPAMSSHSYEQPTFGHSPKWHFAYK